MATYNWTTLANGQVIAFNPNADVLVFNTPSISAADLSLFAFGSTIDVAASGRTVTLQTPARTLTSANVTFQDGSLLLLGDNTTGTSADDAANTLTGGAHDDRLQGLGGNDTMSGGAGDDLFSVGPLGGARWDDDTINGGPGSDTFIYPTTIDGNPYVGPVTVNLATGTATSALGNTSLTSIEVVLASAGNDTLTGGDPAHGPNALGNTTSERFRGLGGNDTITGGAGPAFFTIADYAANTSAQAITANLGTGVVNDGLGGTDTLVNVDSVRGGAGNDTLIGGSTSRSASGTFFESFRGNAGNDTINGNNAGTGGQDASSDRADYSNSTAAVNVNLATGVATDGFGGTDTLIDIDHVYGGGGNDTLTGGSANEDFDGGFGSDTIDGGGGSDTVRFQQSTAAVVVNLSDAPLTVGAVTVAAGKANDGMGGTDTLISIENVRGSDFNDYLRGSDKVATRQFLQGDAGSDTLDGGAGIDFANYGAVALALGGLNAFLENGSGTIDDKMGGTDTLVNIEGLAGTHSADTLTGGLGDQWFRGNGGSDTINGGAGSDWVLYSSDPSGVTINLANGTATDGWNGAGGMLGLGGTDTLVSIENAEASDYADSITGSSEGNMLKGRAGNDAFDGGRGIDTAIFTGDRSAYTITRSGSTTSVVGPDGSDTLTRVERLQFDDAAFRLATNATNDGNGDGMSDILWRSSDGGTAAWQMNGLNIGNSRDFGAVPASWRVVDAHADMNGDGSSDVLWRNNDGDVALWQMNGLQIGASRDFGVVPTSWTVVNAHSDFDGDGSSDVLWREGTNGSVSAWQMSGLNIGAARDFGAVSTSYSIIDANADFNSDGKSDILWRNSDGGVSAWQMNGLNIEASHDFGIVASNWAIVDAHADFNGDGKSDILWRGPDGMVSAWQMNGLTIQAAHDFGVVAPNWTIIDAHGDYNGDGKSDILWRGPDGMVSVWQMDGLNIQAAHDFGVVAPNWTIVDGHADFNGDGKSDILWRGPDGMVSAWQMNGLTIQAGRDFGVVPLSWSIADAAESGATLNGDAGANALLGTLNRDTLVGKAGHDTLTGGAGGDRFVFDTALNGATNVDTITDFTSGSDKLLLSDVIFSNLTAGSLSATNFVSGSNPTAQDANDFVLYNTSTGQVSYDADGSGGGAAVAFATLANNALLTANDIQVGGV